MSKVKSSKQIKKVVEASFNLFPNKYELWISIGLILISLLFFYRAIIFDGKLLNGGDNVAYGKENPFQTELNKGVFPLWTPYVFSGMPSYGSLMMGGNRWYDFSQTIVDYASRPVAVFFKGAEFYYFIMGLSFFLFMLNKGFNKMTALFSALAFIFSTGIIEWVIVGHTTKIAVMAYFPFVLLLVDKLIEKWSWLYAALLVYALHMLWSPSHLQVIFYVYFFIGIYLLYSFLRNLKNKDQMLSIARGAAVLIIGSLVAFSLESDKYFSVLEYSKYSIRGTGPLVGNSEAPATQMQADGGLSYDYATNWSFSPGEVMTFFIPSFYGSGEMEYKGALTNNQLIRQNFYIGPMGFVDGPQYMGIIVLFLAFVGFYYYRKDIFVQSLMIISLISLIISFGRSFPLFYDLMFKYMPYFNKFRIPVMILILLQVSIAIMSGYGIKAIIEMYKSKTEIISRKWFYGIIISLGLLFISLAASSVIIDSYRGVFDSAVKTNIDNSITQGLAKSDPNTVEAYFKIISSFVITDLQFSLGLIFAFVLFTYIFVKKMINPQIFYIGIFALMLFDLWRVGYRPFNPTSPKERESIMAKPDYVDFLQKDKSTFRILELTNGQPSTSNIISSFALQNIYGYSPAKLRIYQDVIENVGIGNPFLWNLLNTKYLISNVAYGDPTLKFVFGNPSDKNSYKIMENVNCLPRGFFVNKYEVKDKLGIINALKEGNFNPRNVAYLEEDPKIKLDSVGVNAKVELTNFSIHYISFDVNATGNNLLFISEIYYPAGWKATIDGVETPIYKTDYIFRSVVVPSGNHKVELTFNPSSYALGKTISLILNIGLVLIFGLYLGNFAIKYRKSRKK